MVGNSPKIRAKVTRCGGIDLPAERLFGKELCISPVTASHPELLILQPLGTHKGHPYRLICRGALAIRNFSTALGGLCITSGDFNR
jgi:hypothetical protein